MNWTDFNCTHMSLPEIHAVLSRIPIEGRTFQTNYFRQHLVGDSFGLYSAPHTLVFLQPDQDFFRLFYATVDSGELMEILKGFQYPGTTVVGYIARNPDPQMCAGFEQAGFGPHAVFLKMTNHALRPAKTNVHLSYAEAVEVDILLARLQADFDRYTSHFPDRDTLLGYIEKRWVLVNRKGPDIKGYVIFQIVGRHAHYNYIANHSEGPMDWLVLQRNFYGVMTERGISAGFLWVENTNERVIRMHKSFGWTLDGVQDLFYLRKSS
jgi:hypothetical protein